MVQAGVTLKVMPESVETDKEVLKEAVKKKIVEVYGEVGEIRESEEPLAFGLVAFKFIFIIDESEGTDKVQEEMAKVEGVGSAQVIDFRRALG
jgi:translation elongation factor aEF-1 beta